MKSTVINGDRPPASAVKSLHEQLDGLTREAILDVYRCMVRSRRLDDKEIQLKNQSQAFFQISGEADEIVYTSLGEGSTSEGEFWEAINATCTKQLPVLFLVEDNGYAISVPVEVETAGGDISRLVRSFPGLRVDSVDGTDFFASLR